MSYYISSNDNRLYVRAEADFGAVLPVTATGRIPAVKLDVRRETKQAKRRDKTGRTFRGNPSGLRSRTTFRLKTYMYGREVGADANGYDSLFASAFGNAGIYHAGATVTGAAGTVLTFSGIHDLQVNQAVASGTEIRFVTAVRDAASVVINAPFSDVGAGTQLAPTITFYPGQQPGSVSLFDYWSPSDAVHRVLRGAVVNEFTTTVNGDYHEFEFAGPAADVIDSATFAGGNSGVTEFPAEPELAAFNYGIIPGHLGQVWLGLEPALFGTLTEAKVSLKNNVSLRDNEFGQQIATDYSAGIREVGVQFSVYQKADDTTRTLYQAAVSQTPISAMLQMGQATGQLFGIHMKRVMSEVPLFDDKDTCLQWRFDNCRAQGIADDEIVVAFA